ncbi:DNA adenine methylase [Beggiatoa leptomitoformis]|nr:DNA adenine methylase [Beggiatoa leptomitoformis]
MNSFLSYVGGKSRLAEEIVKLIPPHNTYAEVFGGAGWVMFRKDPSKNEVINDINGDLIRTYRVIKFHYTEFIRQLRGVMISRDEFNRLLNQNIEHLTDVQRAIRYYYLNKTGYGGRMVKPTFPAYRTDPSRFNQFTLRKNLLQVSRRLARVCVENKTYQDFISLYDTSETVFYVDPPYYDCETYYGKGIFGKEDFSVLAGLLEGVKGKVIISINDRPEIRCIFANFHLREVATSYSLSGKTQAVSELIFTNFVP